MKSPLVRRAPALLLVVLSTLLAGCNTVVMNPSGDVARQEAHLVVLATVLMLLIIVPVIILIVFFAWRYRAANKEAKYEPDWDHSTVLELVIWGAPLLIIIALGLVTWISTHLLDPYRPLSRIDAKRPLAADHKPLVVQVVAMDWKWLFIYPEQGIATVNELVTPVDTPVRFDMTATSVMNAFYIPELAGMVYTMPSMQTQLHAVMNKAGSYEGFSSNYSGAGFSHMRFKYHAVSDTDFGKWVQGVKAGGGAMDRANYAVLLKPSEADPVKRYGAVDPTLYTAILERCVNPGQTCISHMVAADAARAKIIAETCTDPRVAQQAILSLKKQQNVATATN
ncbi:ubiquinol oxidase subunit II [Massilia arenosa]|uniref:Ubiquinol oxidase subunit 2 n=1 Tax=Zemynaea arenosa TaxID=2561931 RepID=A0A4Y9SDR2_9BURK|nr:ubiquinol oxidase subunit II [Massilia arenosa]TFW20827.1 ubiquinol oxidase subunit II [Massilia arenosa]